MGIEKSISEGSRWIQTAEGDLESAEILLKNNRFAHACFHAQQSGEKGIKAVWYLHAGNPWGHSIQKLIMDLKDFNEEVYNSLTDLITLGSKLDKFYIPTRYPNGLPDLTPDDSFLREDAETAIKLAQKILGHVQTIYF